jgi:enoyl-CoA hydratase
VIAKLRGNCLAAATDVALNCDLLIAANDARIGFPATRALGSPANHMWLYHVGPQWAKRLLLTGDVIRGRDAARIGLVLKAVPPEKLDAEVDALARRIALLHPDLAAAHKRIVNAGIELMGWSVLQRMASENDARAHLSPAMTQFVTTAQQQGLKEALRQRDEPFGDGEVHFED